MTDTAAMNRNAKASLIPRFILVFIGFLSASPVCPALKSFGVARPGMRTRKRKAKIRLKLISQLLILCQKAFLPSNIRLEFPHLPIYLSSSHWGSGYSIAMAKALPRLGQYADIRSRFRASSW
jgi:hypothetical protein